MFASGVRTWTSHSQSGVERPRDGGREERSGTAAGAEGREPQGKVPRQEEGGHRQDVERFRHQERCEEFHRGSPEPWMSAAEDGGVRDLVSFVAYANQIQVSLPRCPELSRVRLAGVGADNLTACIPAPFSGCFASSPPIFPS